MAFAEADCVILLSTFNGEKYLPLQLGSIIDQDHKRIRIIVRDDGSHDSTCAILQEYAARGAIQLQLGDNIGARNSFLSLMERQGDGDVVFFADQDDIWHLDKVSRAVEALSRAETEEPVLYCSRVQIVSEDVVTKKCSRLWPSAPAFGNALVENIVMGCSIALNRSAANLIRSRPRPKAAIMHDWWCYLVVSAFGRVIYDPSPSLLYRVHASNTVGLPTGVFESALAKVKRQIQSSSLSLIKAQAQEFREIYDDKLSREQIELIEALTAIDTLGGRFSFLSERRIYRQFFSDDATLRLLVLARGS